MKNKLTDEIVAAWNAGLSSYEISDKLNITRGTVMGVVSRSRKRGVYVQSRPSKKRPTPVKDTKPVEEKKIRIVGAPRFNPWEGSAMPTEMKRIWDGEPKMLADLTQNECRFAVNDAAQGETHLFCAAPTPVGDWVCTGHRKIAYYRAKEDEAKHERRNA
jgi:hypothetical protein